MTTHAHCRRRTASSRPARTLVALTLACLALLPSCYQSHERAADLDVPVGACGSAVPLVTPLTAEQRDGVLERLSHEVHHLADAVQQRRLVGAGPWTYSEDGGSMTVVGTLEERAAGVQFTAEMTFTHWTGRHGGWGFSALDGRACVTIEASGIEGEEPLARVSAVVGLVEDGPLRGSPAVDVWYVATDRLIEGEIAGEPIEF